jgi:hypothetical protein
VEELMAVADQEAQEQLIRALVVAVVFGQLITMQTLAVAVVLVVLVSQELQR